MIVPPDKPLVVPAFQFQPTTSSPVPLIALFVPKVNPSDSQDFKYCASLNCASWLLEANAWVAPLTVSKR